MGTGRIFANAGFVMSWAGLMLNDTVTTSRI